MINGIRTGSGMRLCNPGGKVNVKIPNMRTKGQCKLSEKELINKIQELARKDAAAGKNSRYAESFHGVRQPSAEWQKLKDDFVSFASPNRKGIIRNTLSGLTGNVTFMSFRDGQGHEIAHYSKANGWQVLPTPAEGARNNAFFDLWNQALADAQAELKQDAGREWIV